MTGETASPPDEETRLIAACRKGDPDAFSDLIRLHERRVFRLAGRFFRQRADVEEVAQETFLIAWSKLHTYREDAPFESWLTRVCLNCCYARLRRARPTEELVGEPAEATAAHPAARIEVERLLRTLPPADRFVLLMLYGEGWSMAEIAEKTGWSVSKVKVRAHRARKKLRRLLEAGIQP
jgi:RNA polymerase sigma-70 factor (ECF subfamily)